MIKKDDKVKIEYTGSFEDGTIFDSSKKHGKPLEVELGKHQIIKGFEDAIIGMELNQEKEITIQPDEAYGQPLEKLKRSIPKDKIPIEVKEGSMVNMQLPNGQKIPAKVIEITDKEIKIDLNHPLAGKVLKFKIKVIEVL